MILSALGFALMAALVKVAGLRGFTVLQIIAARAFVSLGISWWDTHRKRISPFGQHRKLLFARGLIGFLALMCVYSAVIHLPLAEATILQYTHPIFTLLFALVALKEAVNRATLLCIALSILGLVVILQPSTGLQESANLPPYFVFLALLGAAGSGAAYVLVRKLAPLEDSSVIIFYFPLVCLPSALVLGWRDFIMPIGCEWLILLGVGVFTQVGQWGLTKGLALYKAGTVVAFSYVQVPLAAMLGLLFFNESLSVTSILGGSLIILGAWINTKDKT